MLKIIAVTLALSITTETIACSVPVTPLKEGEPSPCEGYLFSPEKELQLRIQNEDYKALQEEVKIYLQQKELFQKEVEVSQQIIDKEQQKTELWKKQAEDSTQKLVEKEERQATRDWLFLISGVLLTVAAGYALGQASKH